MGRPIRTEGSVMVRIFQTTEIGAPGDDVWRIAGRPESIADFHPHVVSSSLEGDVRTSTLVDGSMLVERIVERSIVHRFYTYELVGGLPAVRRLRGCLGVRGHGDHSHLDWDVELDAEDGVNGCELAHALDRAFGEALQRLRGQLERAVAAA
jgi:polyketide cyclase/dehydrase/lipid transport protein